MLKKLISMRFRQKTYLAKDRLGEFIKEWINLAIKLWRLNQ